MPCALPEEIRVAGNRGRDGQTHEWREMGGGEKNEIKEREERRGGREGGKGERERGGGP